MIEYLLILAVLMLAAIPMRNVGSTIRGYYEETEFRIASTDDGDCGGGTYVGGCNSGGGPEPFRLP